MEVLPDFNHALSPPTLPNPQLAVMAAAGKSAKSATSMLGRQMQEKTYKARRTAHLDHRAQAY